mmetsp:Transcript_81855/g.171215  ORF Transcript_81855/g.171215 Transcript_81855/m.171215 type:complete len:821 (-) Transcript_81855:236-2698(-)|eukprot:CAMPEP_0206490572 /NCGR_PEP_ID=MMETSP0324_2-20121206/44219_1 /ASSEMBLY_ACC=CAM_ASM_000836 /TAXON_ID=2866 /ORGANISM="Crypthecodinium cohnii, Strain Seligo" /LENGTH=820 /DNA_ID=CAMNT_0053971075 /DNA_START=146 /DNA_END=2608 /DNA_ORIENTATION=+
MPKPGAPAAPELIPSGPDTFKIVWTMPEAEPDVGATTIKVKISGSQRYQNFDHATGRLVNKGGATVPAPLTEVKLSGCLEGVAYEAIVAVMNAEGWSDISPPSKPTSIGELKPRAKPPKSESPNLEALGSGRLRISWKAPEACPPIEACQVQVTDVSSGLTLLVDASNGKLVQSGRTTFAASRTECTVQGVQDATEYAAAVCFRNAEGFGEYSSLSDSVANAGANASDMQLVLHQGPSQEVPLMEPIGQGQMKIRWLLPEGAKSTMVKLRRTGDHNWYLCGGSAVAAPATETVATGLEDGVEYESIIAFLVNGRWSAESAISKPTCIGHKRLPEIPDAPQAPKIIVDQAQGGMKVRWSLFPAVPPLTGCSVRLRPVGAKTWQYVHPTTWQLMNKECDPIPITNLEISVLGVTAGVKYEASVAFRNKLGQGPYSALSDIACIGRPTPKWITCQFCYTDYDIQHAEYTKREDYFWCPLCRFRRMDPFNSVVDPFGILLCHIVLRPKMTFSVDLPDLKQWRKDDQSVFMRMVKVDTETCTQAWPHKLTFEANGAEVFSIKEPEEGHIRRDVPANISSGLKPGINTISITMEDENPTGYAFALVRTQTMTTAQIATATPTIAEDTAQERVMALLADTWAAPVDNDDDEEITCVISNKLKLRCPLSFERCSIPVRGENCMHLQCFGLLAYLESNMKMRALNNRWTCPVCNCMLRPQDLRRDAYVEKVLAETPEHIDEVLIMQDGSYRCIEEAPSGGQAAIDRAAQIAEEAAKAAAVADDGDVEEMFTTINDTDVPKQQKRKAQPSIQKHLTKRQRARMGSENDSD